MTLAQVARGCRHRWATIVAGTTLGGLAALGYFVLAPATYESSTALFVTTTARTPDGQIAPEMAASAEDRVRSYARLATSEQVLKAVISDLRLPVTTADLAAHIRASADPGTVLIDVRARDSEPGRARDIAAKVAEHLPKVVQRLESTDESAVDTPITVRVTTTAEVPGRPASPDRNLSLLIGLLAGTGGGVLGAAVQTLGDRRLRTRGEVAEQLGLPVLTEIPEHPEAGIATFAGADPLGYAEAYRRLRSHLYRAPTGRSLGAILVSSARADEGRTTTATNLALALAHGGLNVVLIDADLRRPGVDALLATRGPTGLSALLAGTAPLASALQRWGREVDLKVITAGPAVSNPGDLLTSARMASLVEAFVANGLTVVLDAPALSECADAAALARIADGVLLVVRSGAVTVQDVGAAAAELRALGASLLGVALNRTPAPITARRARGEHTASPGRRGRKGPAAVEIPHGSAAGVEGFAESAPPATVALPGDSLASAVSDLFGGTGFGGTGFDGAGYDETGYDRTGYDGTGSDGAAYDGAGFDGTAYDGTAYDGAGYDGAGYDKAVQGGSRQPVDVQAPAADITFDRWSAAVPSSAPMPASDVPSAPPVLHEVEPIADDAVPVEPEFQPPAVWLGEPVEVESPFGIQSSSDERLAEARDTAQTPPAEFDLTPRSADAEARDAFGGTDVTSALDGTAFEERRFDGSTDDSTAFDRTSYDRTSYDRTSYDRTAFDSTAFDSTSYDSTSYDSTSYDSTSYDSTSYDSTSYDSTSYDSTASDSTSYDRARSDTRFEGTAFAADHLDLDGELVDSGVDSGLVDRDLLGSSLDDGSDEFSLPAPDDARELMAPPAFERLDPSRSTQETYAAASYAEPNDELLEAPRFATGAERAEFGRQHAEPSSPGSHPLPSVSPSSAPSFAPSSAQSRPFPTGYDDLGFDERSAPAASLTGEPTADTHPIGVPISLEHLGNPLFDPRTPFSEPAAPPSDEPPTAPTAMPMSSPTSVPTDAPTDAPTVAPLPIPPQPAPQYTYRYEPEVMPARAEAGESLAHRVAWGGDSLTTAPGAPLAPAASGSSAADLAPPSPVDAPLEWRSDPWRAQPSSSPGMPPLPRPTPTPESWPSLPPAPPADEPPHGHTPPPLPPSPPPSSLPPSFLPPSVLPPSPVPPQAPTEYAAAPVKQPLWEQSWDEASFPGPEFGAPDVLPTSFSRPSVPGTYTPDPSGYGQQFTETQELPAVPPGDPVMPSPPTNPPPDNRFGESPFADEGFTEGQVTPLDPAWQDLPHYEPPTPPDHEPVEQHPPLGAVWATQITPNKRRR